MNDCELNVEGLNREEYVWVRKRFGCWREIFADREGFECRVCGYLLKLDLLVSITIFANC